MDFVDLLSGQADVRCRVLVPVWNMLVVRSCLDFTTFLRSVAFVGQTDFGAGLDLQRLPLCASSYLRWS